MRDVAWLHPDGREMNDGDWQDRGASVLGMHLRTGADRVLVWFNRRAEAARAVLPEGHWAIGMQSDDKARVTFWPGCVMLPPRSVIALIPSTTPAPEETVAEDEAPAAEAPPEAEAQA